jgi:hypothetical protein
MLYQLPNGKVLFLSVEEYLNMSDEELHELANSGYGEYVSNNAHFSNRGKKATDTPKETPPRPGLDYTPDNDETDTSGPIDLNNLEE